MIETPSRCLGSKCRALLLHQLAGRSAQTTLGRDVTTAFSENGGKVTETTDKGTYGGQEIDNLVVRYTEEV